MEVGVAVPERLIGFDPAVLRDFAVHAEELGFSYLTATDYVLGATHDARNPPFPSGGDGLGGKAGGGGSSPLRLPAPAWRWVGLELRRIRKPGSGLCGERAAP